jgi:hypothetical protein
MTEYSYYHICQMIDEKERLVLESRNNPRAGDTIAEFDSLDAGES